MFLFWDPGKEQQKDMWPHLWPKCLAMCQYFQIKMFGFHSQNVSGLTTETKKRQLLSTGLSWLLWSNKSKHFAPGLCLLLQLCMDKNSFWTQFCHSTHIISSSGHAFWTASGIPWQTEDALMDWAAAAQCCKYLFKRLSLMSSSLFIKLSHGKPIWHLVPNLYRKAQSLLKANSNLSWRENLNGCQCNFFLMLSRLYFYTGTSLNCTLRQFVYLHHLLQLRN